MTGHIIEPPAGLATYGKRIPIGVRDNTELTVSAGHGPDWFALHVGPLRFSATLYLKRAELRALRDRLDEIDRLMPEPETKS